MSDDTLQPHPSHDFDFDPTYGYDLEALLAVGAPEGPADFADFWRDTYSVARNVPTRIEMRPVESPSAKMEVFEIDFDALGDDGTGTRRIGGWLARPRDEQPKLGVVWGHGYGGREAPNPLDSLPEPAVILFPCARGFHRSASPELPNVGAEHVLHGIERRETYLHRGCCCDIWAAATALLEVEPGLEGHLAYAGGSFGGGIGALSVPWEPRFRRAFLDIPSFGPHPLRVTMKCVGSGESVRKYHESHPEVIEVLKYFDAATAARHIEVPTLVAAARFDPAVPPPGQFSIYNAIPADKRLFVRDWAHFDRPHPDQDLRLEAEIADWLVRVAK